jgi:hypothetical protein
VVSEYLYVRFCFLSKGRKSLFLRGQKCLQKSKMDKNKCPFLEHPKYFPEKGLKFFLSDWNALITKKIIQKVVMIN